jgi:hypothetical protein
MTTATTLDLAHVEQVLVKALAEAQLAARTWLDQHGDRDCCGFAFTDVYGVRSNSKLGKLLASYGFRKSYTGALQLWDPSRSYTQSITPKEVAAQVVADALSGLGLRAYAGSRVD